MSNLLKISTTKSPEKPVSESYEIKNTDILKSQIPSELLKSGEVKSTGIKRTFDEMSGEISSKSGPSLEK